MKTLSALTALSLFSIFAACSITLGPSLKGSGNVVEELRDQTYIDIRLGGG